MRFLPTVSLLLIAGKVLCPQPYGWLVAFTPYLVYGLLAFLAEVLLKVFKQGAAPGPWIRCR